MTFNLYIFLPPSLLQLSGNAETLVNLIIVLYHLNEPTENVNRYIRQHLLLLKHIPHSIAANCVRWMLLIRGFALLRT